MQRWSPAGTILVAALSVIPALAPGRALAQGCEELWFQRNRIFKEAGYCFRTPRGIRAFGNAGCSYDDEGDVPLSARQREVVTEIRRAERMLGCAP
ncbi:YARHG domain-containing protein [Methylobacterium sp. JK268]